MKESEVPTATRNIVYGMVRFWGEKAWNQNLQERLSKMPKVVPLDRKDFPPNWSWEKYRDEVLVKQKVTDPIFTGDQYCVIGNGLDVPNDNYVAAQSNSESRIVQSKYPIPRNVERRAKDD